MDYSSKNLPLFEKHYYLTDMGTEIRMRSFIWNDWDWDGFYGCPMAFNQLLDMEMSMLILYKARWHEMPLQSCPQNLRNLPFGFIWV